MTSRSSLRVATTFPRLKKTDTLDKGMSVFTADPIFSGQTILQFQGFPIPKEWGSNSSIQIDDATAFEALDRNAIENFLGHACEPNACIQMTRHGLELIALEKINPGYEVTIDYDATEYDMMAEGTDFHCQCGSTRCRGRIMGFSYLDAGQREWIRAIVLPYLKRKLER